MSTFPVLKTGAVAQYPWTATTRYATEAVQFLDGSRQTFRLFPKALRRWTVQLDALDEQELDAFISFVEAQGSDPFTFTDPATATAVVNCVISADGAAFSMVKEMSGQVTFVVEELA